MKSLRSIPDPLATQLKQMVADLFRLDIVTPAEIPDDEPLLESGLGLDSLDALELALCIEEEFGVVIQTREEATQALASFTSLVAYIRDRTQLRLARAQSPAAA